MKKERKVKDYCLILILNVIATLINIRIGALILLCVVLYIFVQENGTRYDKILIAITYSAPFYPISFWGTHARFSLCTLLSVIFCLLCFFEMLQHGVEKRIVVLLYVFLLSAFAYFISATFSANTAQMLFDTYQILLICMMICVLEWCRSQGFIYVDAEEIATLFVHGVVAITVGLYFQYGAYNYLDISFGEMFTYRFGRRIFNLYITAKSILSYYISVGMIYYFIQLFRRYHIKYVVMLGLMLGGMLINNSRTGMACFSIVAVIYTVFHINKAVKNIRLIVFAIIMVCGVLFVVQTMMESRSALSSFSDDNGRNDLNIAVLRILPNYILSGIGGCVEDYAAAGVMTDGKAMEVHNIILANMIQYGCVGGMVMNLFLCSPVIGSKNDYVYMMLGCILAGLMFANWQNGVFVIPVYISAILGKNDRRGYI